MHTLVTNLTLFYSTDVNERNELLTIKRASNTNAFEYSKKTNTIFCLHLNY